MAAGGAEREEVLAPAGEKHGFVADVSLQHLSIGDRVDRDPRCEIGSLGFRRASAHEFLGGLRDGDCRAAKCGFRESRFYFASREGVSDHWMRWRGRLF